MFKKQMTHTLRKKISVYIKSHKDISELIEGVDIRGENLARSHISNLVVPCEDISEINLTNAKVKLIAPDAKIVNCKFIRTVFLPGSNIRGSNCRHSNFYQADCGFIDYSYADLRGTNICGTILSFSSRLGKGAKFSKNVLYMLEKWWDIREDGPPMLNVGE